MTLARSLRALCAVGLVSLSRKGGCTKGGQRLASLYRLTDRECFEIPAKYLTAKKETNEWKRITSVEMAKERIEAAETTVKKSVEKLKALGHGVTATRTPHDVIGPLTTSRDDVWIDGPGHGVTVAKKPENPVAMRASTVFSGHAKKANHRTPRVSPLYIATPTVNLGSIDGHEGYRPLQRKPARLFTNLIH